MKNARQQEKLLRLRTYFLQETDEEHGVTMEQILAHLQSCGIRAERKSIYENIETLNACGMDILMERRGGKAYYYAASRDFETAELHLLADAVAASRFITEKKSAQLLEKLSGLASRHAGADMMRQVRVPSRIKNMNETIFYLVDALHTAMARDRAVAFRYQEWRAENGRLRKEDRHAGREYTVSPWQLLWQDEFYYLIGYHHASGEIRHYRVDRMRGLRITAQQRAGTEAVRRIHMEDYTARLFGMFGGQTERVVLSFPPRLLDSMVDRFGKELKPAPLGDRLAIHIDLIPSDPFFGWLLYFGGEVRIESPAALRAQYRDLLLNIAKEY